MPDLDFPDFSFRVLVHDDVLIEMKRFRQMSGTTPESCGLLLGYVYQAAFEVTNITGPKPSDVRFRFGYERKRAGHLEEAMSFWQRSNGLIGYIGEWHTHPQLTPSPSALDLRASKKLAQKNKCLGLALILGNGAGCAYLTNEILQSATKTFSI